MAFCTECGASLPENMKFCTACGISLKPAVQEAQPPAAAAGAAVAAAATASQINQQQYYHKQQSLQNQQAPQQQQPMPQAIHPAPQRQTYPGQTQSNAFAHPPAASPNAVISTAGYFGLMLLFSIPVAGWIACVVMSFSSGNRNRRNLARAMLIFMVIGLILSVMLYFVFSWAWEAAVESLRGVTVEATVGDAAELGDLGSLIDLLRQNN